jgi:hypothetical protein
VTGAQARRINEVGESPTEVGLIHRDIRRRNVIVEPETMKPVIIDFDHAVEISPIPIHYQGGYICCPQEILEARIPAEEMYVPKPKHDFLAFVVLVLECLQPEKFDNFRCIDVMKRGSMANMALLEFWDVLRNSLMWRDLVKAADEERSEDMEKYMEITYFPSISYRL